MVILKSNICFVIVILISGITLDNTPTAYGKRWFGKRSPPPPRPPPTDDSGGPLVPAGGAPAPMTDRVKEKLGDTIDFVKYCGIYMNRFSPGFHRPNEECCVYARKVNIKYFCGIFFVPQTETVFSPHKVAVIAKDCGKPLRPNTFCGSYWVRGKELYSAAQENGDEINSSEES